MENKLIPDNQIGFLPNTRMIIFVLKSAAEKYTRKKNKLFTCFIDFRKAFDSVWHDALFLKLRQVGVSDLFYRIIKQMYLGNNVCIRQRDGLTQFFSSKIGERHQGCALNTIQPFSW
jgi:hypothetical protein